MEKQEINKENISIIAKNIRKHLKKGVILSISGKLGVGKTTLIKNILPEHEVKSPSFLHILIYENFAHIDAYTFKSKEAFLACNIQELLEEKCLIIEWGELFEETLNLFEAKIIKIEMQYDEFNEKRFIFFNKSDI